MQTSDGSIVKTDENSMSGFDYFFGELISTEATYLANCEAFVRLAESALKGSVIKWREQVIGKDGVEVEKEFQKKGSVDDPEMREQLRRDLEYFKTVAEVSSAFLGELERIKKEEDRDIQAIGIKELYDRNIKDYARVISPIVVNYDIDAREIQEKSKKYEKILPLNLLQSYRANHFQRLPRHQMLLGELNKRTGNNFFAETSGLVIKEIVAINEKTRCRAILEEQLGDIHSLVRGRAGRVITGRKEIDKMTELSRMYGILTDRLYEYEQAKKGADVEKIKDAYERYQSEIENQKNAYAEKFGKTKVKVMDALSNLSESVKEDLKKSRQEWLVKTREKGRKIVEERAGGLAKELAALPAQRGEGASVRESARKLDQVFRKRHEEIENASKLGSEPSARRGEAARTEIRSGFVAQRIGLFNERFKKVQSPAVAGRKRNTVLPHQEHDVFERYRKEGIKQQKKEQADLEGLEGGVKKRISEIENKPRKGR